jgi:hypothetical protein
MGDSNQIFKRLLFIPGFILIVLLFGCGQEEAATSSAGPTGSKRVLAEATPTSALSAAMEKDGIDSESLCFRVVQPSLQQLPRLEISDQNCKSDKSAPVVASYEMREFIDPSRIGISTGVYILYEQLLPVGEVSVEKENWNLSDLCSIESFYKSACHFKVIGGKLVGVEINPAAATDRLRAVKAVEEINRNLKGEVDKHKAALVELNKHLQGLSTQIVGQRDVMKTTLDAMEPLAQKEEKKVSEVLKGTEGKLGLEARLLENTKQIQTVSSELTELRKSLAEPEKAYLAKEETVKAAVTERKALLVKRSELKAKIKATSEEEEKMKLAIELKALEETISAKFLENADQEEELASDLKKIQTTEEFKKASDVQGNLAKLKSENGLMQAELAKYRDKANAIVLLKNHLATAKKLLAEQKLREMAVLLPQLGALAERVGASAP